MSERKNQNLTAVLTAAPLRFASVCDGISTVGVAWKPLGWQFAFKSEIEPFPSAVADLHHPEAPNLGDMTKFNDWNDYGIDLICGGTPCQAFSVAGLRKGLDDPRGNLTLTYLAIVAKLRPRWVVWENVPGVLSDKTGAFGSFLGGLGQLGYGFAYRVLDAQYFGVAQRRRRVFVVGHIGGLWKRAAAVLFERACLSGHPAPSRQTRKGIAASFGSSVERGSTYRWQNDSAGIIEDATAASLKSKGTTTDERSTGAMVVSPSLTSNGDAHSGFRDEHGLVISGNDARAVMMRGREGCEGGGKGPLLSIEKSLTLAANTNDQVLFQSPTILAHGQGNAEQVSDGSPSLTCNHEAPICFQPRWFTRDNKTGSADSVSGATPTISSSHGNGDSAPHIAAQMSVRRLTPRECERLQGFPDDYTRIKWRGKPPEDCPDGPRYKALGNSMAVPVMRWIGERIALVDAIK